ncbi:pyridoxal phosphate-dependent transferase [Xylariaceae sp. FL0662B]|nr:pyridoxal phosphate-dependent transferase [Xylariaceae sp. FL0662B]
MLSTRMSEMTERLLPTLGVLDHAQDSSSLIDLSRAENALIQDELVQIIREAAFSEHSKDFALPSTFGGDLATRYALAGFFNAHFHPANDVGLDEVVLTAGAGSCIDALMQSLCDEGDSVLVPTPYWFGFQPYITERAKVHIIPAHTSTNFNHASELLGSLEAALQNAPEPSRVKALLLCNPQNPLSQCYPVDVLKGCLRFCHRNDLHLVSDEIYALATLSTEVVDKPGFFSALSVHSSDTELSPSRIHVVWSASKLFGLSGLRIGCLISQGNPSIRAAVSLLTYAGVSSASATMITTILTSPKLPTVLSIIGKRLSRSYSVFAKGFKRLGIEFIPATHGLFIFARIRNDIKTKNEEMKLIAVLKQCGILVSPGWLYTDQEKEFGWVRVTFAIPEAMAEDALLRFTTYASGLTCEVVQTL